MSNELPANSANQAPRPRKVEWEQPCQLFDDTTRLGEALRRIDEYDQLGVDHFGDIEGNGVAGFPETKAQLELPDGTIVNVYIHAMTLAQIQEEGRANVDRSAPWGAPFSGHFTPDGVARISQFPLALSADWSGPNGLAPRFTATITGPDHSEPFEAVGWDFRGDNNEFVGGLQPSRITESSLATTLIPGTVEFAAGMSIVFHAPKPRS